MSANSHDLHQPASAGPARYQRSSPSSSTPSPRWVAQATARPMCSRPAVELGQRTVTPPSITRDPSGLRQASCSSRACERSTEMRRGKPVVAGGGGGLPVASGASSCAPMWSAGSAVAAGKAPSGGGGSGSGGWGASGSDCSKGLMSASQPSARASTSPCPGPHNAMWRALGNSTGRAIGARQSTRSNDWNRGRERREACRLASDCIPAGRDQDSAHEPGWLPVTRAAHDFELFASRGHEMNQFFEGIAHHWNGGGPGMYPIAICLVFAIAVIIDRVQVLFFSASVDKDEFLRGPKTHIFNGDLDKAISYTAGQKQTPLTNIVKAGLINVPKGEDEVQAAMDEASLRELPRIEKRTGYLAMIGNVATLVGLLGTIIGLIQCFAGVAGVDASEKARVLSDGISEAMNCTAFGLIVAIPALVAFSLLQGRTQHMIDDINETSVGVLNLIVANKDKMRIPQNLPQAQ